MSDVHVPPKLERAYARLLFPPSYVVVGAYRLLSDRALLVPAWTKCRNGVRRGAIVGFVWTCLTFKIQRKIVETFYMKSPKVTGLSDMTLFGYQLPMSLPTYATIFFLGSQLTTILTFFLSRNLRIARERAYAQTVASRGKPEGWWGAYVEERVYPPRVRVEQAQSPWAWDRLMGSFAGRMLIRHVVLAPLNFIPFLGILIGAWIKALGTARYLHKPYFAAKKMTPLQTATFVEERKWEYRAFGFAAALLESLPVVGLAFTISNRVGAAMWAHDLEKNQHFVAEQLAAGRTLAEITGAHPRVDAHAQQRARAHPDALAPRGGAEEIELRRVGKGGAGGLSGVGEEVPGGF